MIQDHNTKTIENQSSKVSQHAKKKQLSKTKKQNYILLSLLALVIIAVLIVAFLLFLPKEKKEVYSLLDAKHVQVGDVVTFGVRSALLFDSRTEEPMEFLVLDVHDDEAIILSAEVLSFLPYHMDRGMVRWPDSDLREYLNEDFYRNAFSDAERAMILENSVAWDSTGEEENSLDWISLLSSEEALSFFSGKEERIAYFLPSEDSISDGETEENKEASEWWLRGTDGSSTIAPVVSENGEIGYGKQVNQPIGVRPVIRVKIGK